MSVRKVIPVLQQHQSFVISTHVGPDPDGLSSQLILAAMLRRLGKSVSVINEAPLPERYRVLPHWNWIKTPPSRWRRRPEVLVTVDCGELSRIGETLMRLSAGLLVINIDHHLTNTRFGDVFWVDPTASSTAEMMHALVTKAGWAWTEDTARLCYIGIMTDTGCFRYENTTAKTHRVVADLLRRFPIPVRDLHRRIYENVPLNDFRLFIRLFSRVEFLWRGRVAMLSLPRRLMRRFSEQVDVRDFLFQWLRLIQGVEVVVILTEVSPSETRINFRSNGALDVAALAQCVNGGGHHRASGGYVPEPLAKTKRRILRLLKERMAS